MANRTKIRVESPPRRRYFDKYHRLSDDLLEKLYFKSNRKSEEFSPHKEWEIISSRASKYFYSDQCLAFIQKLPGILGEKIKQ